MKNRTLTLAIAVIIAIVGIIAVGSYSRAHAADVTTISVKNKSPRCSIKVGYAFQTTIKAGKTGRASSKTGRGTVIYLKAGDHVKVTQRKSGRFIQEFTALVPMRYSISSDRKKNGTSAINVRRTRC